MVTKWFDEIKLPRNFRITKTKDGIFMFYMITSCGDEFIYSTPVLEIAKAFAAGVMANI